MMTPSQKMLLKAIDAILEFPKYYNTDILKTVFHTFLIILSVTFRLNFMVSLSVILIFLINTVKRYANHIIVATTKSTASKIPITVLSAAFGPIGLILGGRLKRKICQRLRVTTTPIGVVFPKFDVPKVLCEVITSPTYQKEVIFYSYISMLLVMVYK
jgi:hypothetical protein